MSTRASRSKGEGWALTRVPPQIARNVKNGGWALTQQNTVTLQITIFIGCPSLLHRELLHSEQRATPTDLLGTDNKVRGRPGSQAGCGCGMGMSLSADYYRTSINMLVLHVSLLISRRLLFFGYKPTVWSSLHLSVDYLLVGMLCALAVCVFIRFQLHSLQWASWVLVTC